MAWRSGISTLLILGLHSIRSRFGLGCFKGADLGAEFLHRSFIRLVLTGGGIVTGTLVEQAQKADGIHRAEVISKDCDSLAVEVDGIGVIRGGAHKISGGGDGIQTAGIEVNEHERFEERISWG